MKCFVKKIVLSSEVAPAKYIEFLELLDYCNASNSCFNIE